MWKIWATATRWCTSTRKDSLIVAMPSCARGRTACAWATSFETAEVAMAGQALVRRGPGCGWAAAISLCLAVATSGTAFGASDTRPQAHLHTGVMQGVEDAGARVAVYKGVPFAKP